MSNQVATTKLQQPAKDTQALSSFLGSMKAQIELALPQHLTADRMCRLVLTEFSKNPNLKKCSLQSIAACVMTSSQLGLEIGVNGQAYMIPYGNTATFVPGWKGLIDLVNRSGKASVWTGAVFAGDFFEWELGSDPRVIHRPAGESDPSKMLFAYAIGRLKGAGYPIIECWPNDRLKKHFAANNKVGQRHYGNKHWEMYARKIVLLQVLKYLPQSVDLSTAIAAEYKGESGVVSGSVVKKSNLEALTSQLNGSVETEASEPEETKSKSDNANDKSVEKSEATNESKAESGEDSSGGDDSKKASSESEVRALLSECGTVEEVTALADKLIAEGSEEAMVAYVAAEIMDSLEGKSE